MHPKLSLLALFCLTALLGGEVAGSDSAGQRSQATTVTRSSTVVTSSRTTRTGSSVWKRTVQLEKDKHEGKRTRELAELAVLEKARLELANLVRQIKPDSRWIPSIQYIKSHLVKPKSSGLNPEIIPEEGELESGEPYTTYLATVELEMSSRVRDDILRQIRYGDARERQWVLGKVLLAILSVIGTAAGYFQLEDRTKGYYTAWLRLAAAGALAAAGFGIAHLP
jgi:hypothetical protein